MAAAAGSDGEGVFSALEPLIKLRISLAKNVFTPNEILAGWLALAADDDGERALLLRCCSLSFTLPLWLTVVVMGSVARHFGLWEMSLFT